MASPKIALGALNISADPHPTGIYRQLFEQAAGRPVRLWGHEYAKVTKPQDRGTNPPSFYGRVLCWTEIDRQGKWLNQRRDREATPAEKAAISIPDDLDPNFRSFNFVFLEKKHVLVIEYQNELNQHFGPQRAERFFSLLLNERTDEEGEEQDEEDVDSPDVDEKPQVSVTVIPASEALDKIYAIPRLRTLEIYIVRPNPDDMTDAANRLLDRLVEQGAKAQTVKLEKRARVKTLKPDEETDELAQIAQSNGYVSEPIREVWIHDEAVAAIRLSMMRIIARRTKAATVVA